MIDVGHFINGSIERPDQPTIPLHDPATARQVGVVRLADAATVERAVGAAADAAELWSQTTLSARSQILFDLRSTVKNHAEELATLISEQHGKTVPDALGEVARGLECLDFACGIPHLLKGEHSHEVANGVDVYSIRVPLGVVASITPFNFPVMVPLWMLSNAVACGNSVVLKPSEKDPSPTIRLAELFTDAGLPDGVLNVVNGHARAVDQLLEHPDIAAVSFVGSTPVARHIYETAAAKGKRVQALGGAKNHMVVLPDADVDAAADAAISAGFGSAGERCMAISVVVAVGDVADELVDAIVHRARALVVGPATSADSEMGPLITAAHRDRVVGLIDSARPDGAEIVLDGSTLGVGDGYFVGPTVIDGVLPGMAVYDEEIFGPVLSIVRVDTFERALELINVNAYANGAAIFTRDGGAARKFEREARAGMLGINVPIPVPVGWFSFGGWRSSLFGDTRMYGPDGIKFFTQSKVVSRRWPDPSTSSVDLGFPQN